MEQTEPMVLSSEFRDGKYIHKVVYPPPPDAKRRSQAEHTVKFLTDEELDDPRLITQACHTKEDYLARRQASEAGSESDSDSESERERERESKDDEQSQDDELQEEQSQLEQLQAQHLQGNEPSSSDSGSPAPTTPDEGGPNGVGEPSEVARKHRLSVDEDHSCSFSGKRFRSENETREFRNLDDGLHTRAEPESSALVMRPEFPKLSELLAQFNLSFYTGVLEQAGYTDVASLIIDADGLHSRGPLAKMVEILSHSMKPGHLDKLVNYLNVERIFLLRQFGSLEALRGEPYSDAARASQKRPRLPRDKNARIEKKAAKEQKRAAKRARAAERKAQEENDALMTEYENAQRVDSSGRPMREVDGEFRPDSEITDLRIEKAVVWIKNGPDQREKYGLGEDWGFSDFRGQIVEVRGQQARFSLPKLPNSFKWLPLEVVERVHFSARGARAMRTQGSAFLSCLDEPQGRRILLHHEMAAPSPRVIRRRAEPAVAPALPEYRLPACKGPNGEIPPPQGTEMDAESVEIWSEFATKKTRAVAGGGSGVTWYVRGWRFRLETRKTNPSARDIYLWPPETHADGQYMPRQNMTLRSRIEVGRILLGRVANFSDGWRPPAYNAIVELLQEHGWELGRVCFVRGDGAFMAAAGPLHPSVWCTKQTEGGEWRRIASVGTHLRVCEGYVQLKLSVQQSPHCDTSRDADLTERRGDWRRCLHCYRWRRAPDSGDAPFTCAGSCDKKQELSLAQIEVELRAPTWMAPAGAEMDASRVARPEERTATGAQLHAQAIAGPEEEVALPAQGAMDDPSCPLKATPTAPDNQSDVHSEFKASLPNAVDARDGETATDANDVEFKEASLDSDIADAQDEEEARPKSAMSMETDGVVKMDGGGTEKQTKMRINGTDVRDREVVDTADLAEKGKDIETVDLTINANLNIPSNPGRGRTAGPPQNREDVIIIDLMSSDDD